MPAHNLFLRASSTPEVDIPGGSTLKGELASSIDVGGATLGTSNEIILCGVLSTNFVSPTEPIKLPWAHQVSIMSRAVDHSSPSLT